MSLKTKTVYACRECGYSAPKWHGKCPGCDNWDTFEEEIRRGEPKNRYTSQINDPARPVTLHSVGDTRELRHVTGIEEFDRILGGGIVEGSLILLGGEPGIGKSTLLLQVSDSISSRNKKVLYVSGEESIKQTKMRAIRLGASSEDLMIVSETNIDAVIQYIEEIKPKAVIIDSIQIMYSEGLESAPGSVGQLKEITNRFMRLAKERSVTIFLVGHITKEGTIAGPKTIEHIVDTVLYFEGVRYQTCRILRSVKNRFGATDEIGVFSMTETGLAEVKNPSEIFLAERHDDVSGSIVIPTIEGTRPILVEIQALVSPAVYGTPNRKAIGVDYNRMVLLLAVLEKRVGLGLHAKDVFINVAGGARITEPAADLGIVIAVFSSYKDRPVDKGTVAIGEVGLGGEIRSVTETEKRIRESAKLGFDRFIIPKYSLKNISKEKSFGKLNLCGADNVKEALKIVSDR